MAEQQAKPAPRRMGRPRVGSVEGSGDARRDILRAAASLIGSRGLSATTMAGIAESAGLQTPSLYYYFDNKDAILYELAIDANRAPLELIRRLRQTAANPSVCLWAFIVLDVGVLCDLPFDINDVHRFASSNRDADRAYLGAREDLVSEIEGVVSDGIETDVFRTVDVGIAALAILGADEGSQNWLRGAEHFPTDDAAEFLADGALRNLLRQVERLPEDRVSGRALIAELTHGSS